MSQFDRDFDGASDLTPFEWPPIEYHSDTCRYRIARDSPYEELCKCPDPQVVCSICDPCTCARRPPVPEFERAKLEDYIAQLSASLGVAPSYLRGGIVNALPSPQSVDMTKRFFESADATIRALGGDPDPLADPEKRAAYLGCVDTAENVEPPLADWGDPRVRARYYGLVPTAEEDKTPGLLLCRNCEGTGGDNASGTCQSCKGSGSIRYRLRKAP